MMNNDVKHIFLLQKSIPQMLTRNLPDIVKAKVGNLPIFDGWYEVIDQYDIT